MNQQSLFSEPVGAVAQALQTLSRDPLAFSKVTEFWLLNNKHVWRAFYNSAERFRRIGRNHVGAKYIIEDLRINTGISDSGKQFKLNNSYVSGLSRLYNAVIGYDFFETRKAA